MNTKEIEVHISNKLGLHARPATELAEIAGSFNSDIKIITDNRSIDAKSVMELMTLAATCGTKLKISAEGGDAEQATAKIKKLIDDKFGEQE